MAYYHVGFTGTQRGMTKKQNRTFKDLLSFIDYVHRPLVLHHGDCIGADSEAHRVAQSMGFKTESYPADTDHKRAFTNNHIYHVPKPPLERNHDIVDACSVLLACPKTMEEQLRSGTWATVRYAVKQDVPVVIIWPDGTMERR